MKQVWKIRGKRTGNFHSEEYPSEKAAEEALDHSIAAGFWREYFEVVKYDV